MIKFLRVKKYKKKLSSLGWSGLNDEFSDFPLEPNLNLSLVVVPDDQITMVMIMKMFHSIL